MYPQILEKPGHMVTHSFFANEEPCANFLQVQGRSYANIFGLVERFINAKILEVSQNHWPGDQAVRLTQSLIGR